MLCDNCSKRHECPEYSDSITSDRAYYELIAKEKTCKSYNKEATE